MVVVLQSTQGILMLEALREHDYHIEIELSENTHTRRELPRREFWGGGKRKNACI